MRWQPDEKQWRVLWTAYALAFLLSVEDWDRPVLNGFMSSSNFVIFVVVAAALLLVHFEQKKNKRL